MTKKRIFVLGLIAVVAVVATALYAGWHHRDGVLQGSGTVEARNIRVGSKIGGRIAQVRVRESDLVEPGQVLVVFDDQELKAALEQSRANLQKMLRGYRPEEIAEARAATEQARAEYDMKKKGYRREDIEAARAELERAKADEARSETDFQRYDALAKREMVSRQQRDAAEANWKMAVAHAKTPSTSSQNSSTVIGPKKSRRPRRASSRPRPSMKRFRAATAARTSSMPAHRLPTTKRVTASGR